MATRHAIRVTDDHGIYQIKLGAAPARWAAMRRALEEGYAYEDESTWSAERLTGWEPWQWAIHAHTPNAQITNIAVCFVDGDEPPALPYAAN